MHWLGVAAGAIVAAGASRCFVDPVWADSELYHATHTYGSAFNPLTNKTQSLDVDFYAPPPSGDRREMRPTVVLVHGGSFVSGDKAEFTSLGNILAARGFIVASINYRLTGAFWGTRTHFPKTGGDCCPGTASDQYAIDAVEDARAAVRFLRKMAPDPAWRLDPDRIAIGGGSAGAVTALFYGYAARAAGEGKSGNPGFSSAVRTVIPISGELAYDAFCSSIDPTTGEPLGCKYGSWNYTGNVDGAAQPAQPPLLMVHGTADTTVPIREAYQIQARANITGLESKLIAIPGAGHVPLEQLEQQPHLDDMVGYLVRTMALADAECPKRITHFGDGGNITVHNKSKY